MGLLDRFKPGYVDWKQAYVAVPKAYKKEDGSIFGAVALTEYIQKGVIRECNYFKALQKLKKYTQAMKTDAILVRELTLPELESLIEEN